jgi:hypothetical protein
MDLKIYLAYVNDCHGCITLVASLLLQFCRLAKPARGSLSMHFAVLEYLCLQ